MTSAFVAGESAARNARAASIRSEFDGDSSSLSNGVSGAPLRSASPLYREAYAEIRCYRCTSSGTLDTRHRSRFGGSDTRPMGLLHASDPLIKSPVAPSRTDMRQDVSSHDIEQTG